MEVRTVTLDESSDLYNLYAEMGYKGNNVKIIDATYSYRYENNQCGKEFCRPYMIVVNVSYYLFGDETVVDPDFHVEVYATK